MKYVKIKTAYKLSKNVEIDILESKDVIGQTMENDYYKIEILKESDNLEDLCDRYILRDVDIIFLNQDKTEYRFEGSEWFGINNTELAIGIYGAIWTGKGLTYVAKLNKDGELELL